MKKNPTDDHKNLSLARIERHTVEGEVIGVTLHLLKRNRSRIEIQEGDEFVSLLMVNDPWVQP